MEDKATQTPSKYEKSKSHLFKFVSKNFDFFFIFVLLLWVLKSKYYKVPLKKLKTDFIDRLMKMSNSMMYDLQNLERKTKWNS